MGPAVFFFMSFTEFPYLPPIKSWMQSTYMSAWLCSQSFWPANPCCRARYLAIVFDCAKGLPSTSKTGTWPKGVPVNIMYGTQMKFTPLLMVKVKNVYTSFVFGPFFSLKTKIFENNFLVLKDQSSQFSTSAQIEVNQFIVNHFLMWIVAA